MMDREDHAMDERTLEALRASIRHWEEIVALDDDAIRYPPIGPRHCAFCALFNTYAKGEPGCAGCPVAEAGFPGCGDSPYDELENAVCCGDEPSVIRAAARAELEFLRSLEPKTEDTTEEASRHG